ncbi:hypothetical protein [Litoribrevibacter albus]|uniref:Uncharacterized protein n=1 Tax=Litoribrevibacter albus TaxID=1473156 RepID=A0AA37SB26_9GAMM|nr:hypothetical protein [Litoribrevibacter albus]GLQ31643.1 hypothetical protein GCM10007876_21220 [Litoribrevibacter albus]
MALVVLSVDRDLLPPHTDEDFEDWLRFKTGDKNWMRGENPLIDEDLKSEIREIGK